jgi:hypothetical protein
MKLSTYGSTEFFGSAVPVVVQLSCLNAFLQMNSAVKYFKSSGVADVIRFTNWPVSVWEQPTNAIKFIVKLPQNVSPKSRKPFVKLLAA